MKMLIIVTAIAILYVGGGSQIAFGIAIGFYFIAGAAWTHGGGWPEAWYRLRGIAYRQFFIIMPNRRVARPLIKDSDLKIGSAARAEIPITKDKIGDYFIPTRGEEIFANPHGAPASLHNWDDARAIQIFNTEPDVVNSDGKTIKKAKVDAFLVHSAYKNDVLERRHRLNVRAPKIPRVTLLLLLFVLMMSIFSIFYTLYFGNNISCAVHAKSCP